MAFVNYIYIIVQEKKKKKKTLIVEFEEYFQVNQVMES